MKEWLKKWRHTRDRWLAQIRHKLRQKRVVFFPGLNVYDLVRFYLKGIIQGFLTMRAAAIAYSFFMAMFPFLLFMLSAIAFIPIEGFQKDFISFLHDVLPPKTQGLFDNIIYDLAMHKRESLLSIGLLLSVMFFANGINAMLTGFESSVNKVVNKRVFYKKYGFALLIAVFLIIIIILAIALEVYFEIWIYQLNKKGIVQNISSWIYWSKRLIYFLMILLSVSTIYYFGTEEGRKLPFISPGSVLTSVFIVFGFYLYGLYILNFNRYNQLYGSIGALLILQFMFYVMSLILLLGNELNLSILKSQEMSVKNNGSSAAELPAD